MEMITVGQNNKLSFWNLDGAPQGEVAYGAALNDCIKLDDTTIAASSVDGKIVIFDIAGKTVRKTLEGHEGAVNRLCALPDGRLASAGWDKTVRVWMPSNDGDELVRTIKDGHSDVVTGVAYYPERDYLYSCSRDRTVHVWDLEEEEEEEDEPVRPVNVMRAHVNAIPAMDIAPSAGLLFTAGLDAAVQIYNLEEEDDGKEVIGMLADKLFEPLYAIRVIEERSLIVTGSTTGNICVYDMRNLSEHEPVHKLDLHSGLVLHIDRIDADRFVSSGMNDKTVKIWNAQTGAVSKEISFDAPQVGVCFTGKNMTPYLLHKDEAESDIPALADKEANVEVVLANKSLHFFKALAEVISDEIETIEINDTLEVEQEIFLKLLLGVPIEIPQKNLLDYFALFRHLRLRKRAYLVCRQLEKVRNILELLEMYDKCVKKYETERQEGGPFTCAFSLAVFNQLKEREKEIQESPDLQAQIDKMGIGQALGAFTTILLRDHENFQIPEDQVPRTFKDVSRETLKVLHETKKHYNVLVRPSRGSTFVAHLEILIWQSNFFYRMLHFGGRETELSLKKKEIVIEYLSPAAVESLLEYIYLEKVTTDNADIILDLLTHADMYQESKLSNHLKSRLKEITRAVIESGEAQFEGWLRQYGAKLENEKIKGDLTWYWSSFEGWSKEKVEGILETVTKEEPSLECPLLGNKF